MSDKIHITIGDIENSASPQSFQRGEEYYLDGCVEKVVKKGGVFDAIVYGSRRYNVKLYLEDGEMNFNCNCPYDYDGICKHSVAAALAVIEGNYTTDKTYENISGNKAEEVMSFQQFREAVFDETDALKKDDFLIRLFEKNADLRSQFIAFSQTDEVPESAIVIEDIRDDLKKKLSGLNFDDPDYEAYDDSYNHSGYREEWEIMYDIGQEMIKEVFKEYKDHAVKYIKKGNLLDGIKILFGMYEGFFNVNAPASDEYDVFEDYNEELAAQFNEVMQNIVDHLDAAVKTDSAIKQLLALLFERHNIYEQQYDKSKEEENIVYNMKVFEDLLLIMLVNKNIADFLNDLIVKTNVDNIEASFVLLKIADITNNQSLWADHAEKFALYEVKIAIQLMDKYYENKAKDDFYRIAKQSFKKWSDQLDKYLIDKISEDDEPEFYKQILSKLTSRTKDIKRYKELRQMLTKDEKEKFIKDNTSPETFYIKLLEEEERYNEILLYVKNNTHSYDFTQIIRPVLNVYPEECFHIIKTKTDATLLESRGRTIYQAIVRWLLEMKKIKGFEKESVKYFAELYNMQPRLPALRDEFRKANLYSG